LLRLTPHGLEPLNARLRDINDVIGLDPLSLSTAHFLVQAPVIGRPVNKFQNLFTGYYAPFDRILFPINPDPIPKPLGWTAAMPTTPLDIDRPFGLDITVSRNHEEGIFLLHHHRRVVSNFSVGAGADINK